MQNIHADTHAPDLLQSFLIDRTRIGGKLVRLGAAANTIIQQNTYPDPVARLLAEMLTLSAMLSGNLKHDAILTLQATGDGPVRFIVVDATHQGELRGYADLDEEQPLPQDEHLPLRALLGNGRLAMILDQGGERYQGIVELTGNSMPEAIQHYFTQSQQGEMAVKLAVRKERKTGQASSWAAAGLLIERLPAEGGTAGITQAADQDSVEEQWTRARMFMQTATEQELLSSQLSSWTLLKQLFNEDGVWVYPPKVLKAQCRCSRQRILEILSTIHLAELQEIADESGAVSMHCHFCNRTEIVTAEVLAALHPEEAGANDNA